jgi:DUF4097 and DUF4098 domain-containing protein YvlB
MRTGGIIRIIVGLVIALLLTVFLILTFSGHNLMERLGWEGGWNWPFWSTKYSFSDTETDDAGIIAEETVSLSAGDVAAINIEWVAGSVEVRVGGGDEIVFYETARKTLTDAQKMRYMVTSGGELKIQYCENVETVWKWFDKDRYNIPSKALVMTIPASMLGELEEFRIDGVSASLDVDGVSAEKVRLETVSGEIACANLTCAELKLSSTSGRLVCENCDVKDVSLNNVSGNIRAGGTFREIDTETVSGNVRIASTNIPDEIDGDSVSGDITILLPEGAGFTAKLDSVSGELSCEFSGTFSDKKIVCGDGEADYSFDSVSGNIHIGINQ